MEQLRFDLIMSGSGSKQREIAKGYKFLTVMNNSDNRIEVHDAFVLDSDPSSALFTVPPYQAITYPTRVGTLYTFIWLDGGGVGSKKSEVIFSEDNLNINTALGGQGGASTEVIMKTDTIGLAKQSQLPNALEGGRLAVSIPTNIPVTIVGDVEVKNDSGNPIPVNGSVTISNFPATQNVVVTSALPAGTNNIGDVDVISLPSLPAGTNNIGDVDVLSLPSLPAGNNNIGDVDIASKPVTGAHANAWSAAAVLAAGVSAALDNPYTSYISAFGNANAATTITVQVSQNNSVWYDTPSNQVLSGAGDFHIFLNTGARYVRLKSSGAATITATLAGK